MRFNKYKSESEIKSEIKSESGPKSKSGSGSGSEIRSQLAHLLQGAEAAALRAVVMQQQGNILLCVHDGWVAKDWVDPVALAAHIESETGYYFGIECVQLEAPGRDQIKRKLDEFEGFSQGESLFSCPFAVPVAQDRSLGVPSASGKPTPTAETHGLGHLGEASLWTSRPHPDKPVNALLAIVSPRPRWNLSPDSTAVAADSRRVKTKADAARKRVADDVALPE